MATQKLDAKGLFALVKDTFNEWNEDKAPRLAAALAYYTAFSLAPLLLISISIAGLFYADADAAARSQITALIPGGGDAIVQLLDNGAKSGQSTLTAIIGFATLLFGAAGLFGQLQDSLNTIWEVQPKPNLGIMGFIRARFFSFSMVLGTGFLLLVSLLVSSALSILVGYFQNLIPGSEIVWLVVSYLISFVLTSVIFGLIFKVVPDAKIAWRDVAIGAIVTAMLFMIGQSVLNLYLSNQQNAYGAFGSLLVLLLWVFYSAQILFFGAEFTQMYARRYGSRIQPASYAEPVSEASRENQGLPRTGNTDTQGQPQKPDAPARQIPATTIAPSEGPKPGMLTTAAGFALGWLLGRTQRRKNNT